MLKRNRARIAEAKDAALDKLALSIVKVQVRWANFMNRHTLHWNTNRKKWFLIAFVLLTQFVSLAILVGDLRPGSKEILSKPAPMPLPPSASGMYGSSELSAYDIYVIERFGHIVDSMMQTQQGRDSLAAYNQQRPGFIDSVMTLRAQLKNLDVNR